MFGLFKKRDAAPSAEELKRQTGAAREDVKNKWVHFNQTVHLKADVPLSQKVDFFIKPIHQFFQSKYPVLLQGPTEIFWLTVFTAILESGTHPKDEVNAAIEQLRSKYAQGSR